VDVALPAGVTREQQVRLLLKSGRFRFPDLLQQLGRDELKAACRKYELDHADRSNRRGGFNHNLSRAYSAASKGLVHGL
jgi:hypothetical protein